MRELERGRVVAMRAIRSMKVKGARQDEQPIV
jgi:hypothetical protein